MKVANFNIVEVILKHQQQPGLMVVCSCRDQLDGKMQCKNITSYILLRDLAGRWPAGHVYRATDSLGCMYDS